nr:pentatricopeptide repeat-containing protein At1g33350 [Tanacetum cinerariifolium]
MVYGYTRSSKIESVVELFERMPNKDIPSWNSIIAGGVVIIGCLGKRLGLLNACAHGGLVDKGPTFFTSMVNDYIIEPDIHHIGCFIDLLGRAGQFDEAMEVTKAMKTTPDEAIWGLDKLKGFGFGNEWIGSYVSERTTLDWVRMLDTMSFLVQVSYNDEQMKILFMDNPVLLFEGSVERELGSTGGGEWRKWWLKGGGMMV